MIQRLIQHKRDGNALSPEEWRRLLAEFTAGRIPDYQMSALLMAVYFRGVDARELDTITDAMLASGSRFTFDGTVPVVDKHSTGGVGDKVSLVLAPLVASCGLRVPMMSGRGLGHSGGTLDKLEAIPGFRTDLSIADARRQIEKIGCAMIGQTAEIAPADRKLYALRDVTATVEILPLIAASIMSKKLAEGLDGLVLDVKRGNGAFLPELEAGLELAQTMVRLGAARACPTVALVTAMDQPLGRACGNALETEEAILTLQGQGPSDLVAVTVALAAEMLVVSGFAPEVASARATLHDALDSGRAAETFRAIIEAQGGSPAIVDDPAGLPQAPVHRVVEAPRDGVVSSIDTRAIGWGVVALGGGRQVVTDDIDPSVGFVVTAALGDRVSAGEPLASVYACDDATASVGVDVLRSAIGFGSDQTHGLPLVSHRVSEAGVEVLSTA